MLDEEQQHEDGEEHDAGPAPDEGEIAAAAAIKDAIRGDDDEALARALGDFLDAHAGREPSEPPPEGGKGKGLLAIIGMKPKK